MRNARAEADRLAKKAAMKDVMILLGLALAIGSILIAGGFAIVIHWMT